MSPRSAEFFEAAQRRLAAARDALGADPATSLTAAYYAMLYAARAALSECDTYAKTHRGTWHLFREVFVKPGRFDDELAGQAQDLQEEREQADYEAWSPSPEEAERAIDLARSFLDAVEQLVED